MGVVNGNFGFYRGEEKLMTQNKPLQISALPAEMQLHRIEREKILDNAREQRLALRNEFGTIGHAANPVVSDAPDELIAGSTTDSQMGEI